MFSVHACMCALSILCKLTQMSTEKVPVSLRPIYLFYLVRFTML
uniref:Uncharacterized protein n=1 Tax=Arundo donax TaxID=35708 RepID=A0A0A9C9D9_ARUDO